MLTANSKQVNVSRSELIEKLRINLEIHKKDFEEAMQGYRIKLHSDLYDAYIASAEHVTPEALQKIRVDFNYPVSHENDYNEIIAMMKMSVDENINLDMHSFKSYVLNEWSWSQAFNGLTSMYKTYNGNN